MAKQQKGEGAGMRQIVSVSNEPMTLVRQEQTPTDLIAMAIDKNLDMDKLERLMQMQERWEANKARKAFYEAFGRFQSIAPELVKNKQVKFEHRDGGGKTEYKYQELGDIAKHIREPLAECGLSYRWDQKEEAGIITVSCIISHVGGHQEVSQSLSGKADSSGKKNDIQQKASTITYLRRYTLTGMLGLSTMEADDDGRSGVKSAPPVEKKKTDPTPENLVALNKRIISCKTEKEAHEQIALAKEHYNLTLEQGEDFYKLIYVKFNKEVPA